MVVGSLKSLLLICKHIPIVDVYSYRNWACSLTFPGTFVSIPISLCLISTSRHTIRLLLRLGYIIALIIGFRLSKGNCCDRRWFEVTGSITLQSQNSFVKGKTAFLNHTLRVLNLLVLAVHPRKYAICLYNIAICPYVTQKLNTFPEWNLKCCQ